MPMPAKISVNKVEVKPSHKLITDNAGESMRITWDGTRFALTNATKGDYSVAAVIIFNPKEAKEINDFIGKWLGRRDY